MNNGTFNSIRRGHGSAVCVASSLQLLYTPILNLLVIYLSHKIAFKVALFQFNLLANKIDEQLLSTLLSSP